jgi:hypothetical protein
MIVNHLTFECNGEEAPSEPYNALVADILYGVRWHMIVGR